MPSNKKIRMMKHYVDEAEKWGASSASTMEDEITRQRETDMILEFMRRDSGRKVLDLGCGNGYTLVVLSQMLPNKQYVGIDTSKELIDIAKKRKIDCHFMVGDACELKDIADKYFDLVYTQRCLINILSWEDKLKALNEIHRVLKPNGFYLMIECFTDGLENQNKARVECGLPELKPAYHNEYFDKRELFNSVEKKFYILEPWWSCSNFLSSHYFVTRVLHPLVTKGEQIKNTEFVKFFSYLPPMGNYSQIQAYVFRREC